MSLLLTVYRAENGEWSWRGRDGNNRVIAVAGETYTTKKDAMRALSNVVDEFRNPGSLSVPVQFPGFEEDDSEVEMVLIGGDK